MGDYAIQQGSVALTSNYELAYIGANLTIIDVNPLIVMSSATVNLSPGDTVIRPGYFLDPSSALRDVTWKMTVDYGDDTTVGPAIIVTPGQSPGIPFTHVYTKAGDHVATVTVDDIASGGSATLTLKFTVKVAAPDFSQTITGSGSAVVNEPVTLSWKLGTTGGGQLQHYLG